LRAQVDAIEQSLQLAAPAQPEEVVLSPFDREAASAAIARLHSLLDTSDGDSEEAFHNLRDAVSSIVDKPDLDALSASISDFDFEAALARLDGIAEQCCMKARQE
jgi:hypothetical protein